MGKLIERPEKKQPAGQVPPLQSGDRLTRAEFERRYEAMPHLKKAELIEGVVHMPSPVTIKFHGEPHFLLGTWLGVYQASTPGVAGAHDATVRLDWDNEPQPDVSLRSLPSHGGQSRTSAEGYLEGSPELIGEVAATSASYDLHAKLGAYRRNGVREYLVPRILDGEVDWFILRGGQYERIPPDPQGVVRSETFPGLWLDPAALLRGDLARLLEVLGRGLAAPEHAAFVSRLEETARASR